MMIPTHYETPVINSITDLIKFCKRYDVKVSVEFWEAMDAYRISLTKGKFNTVFLITELRFITGQFEFMFNSRLDLAMRDLFKYEEEKHDEERRRWEERN